MKEVNLKDGDRVFCDGAYLIRKGDWYVFDGYEGEIYFNGEVVEGEEVERME